MPVNEKSKENLKPFEPGNNRNPKGRGKGVKNRATLLKELLNIKTEVANPLRGAGVKEKMTVEKAIELKLIHRALQGDIRAIQLISEKMYGKIPVDVNLTENHNDPVCIDKKITAHSTLDLLIIKYGMDSYQVKKFQETYGSPGCN